jgi:hypothetical protein
LAAALARRHGGATLRRTGYAWALPLLAMLASCASYREGYDRVTVGPPPPPLSETPTPRPGYVWAPGYWDWEGNAHAWVEGHWMPARTGEHWVADQWDRENGRWRFEPGHWALGTTAVLR